MVLTWYVTRGGMIEDVGGSKSSTRAIPTNDKMAFWDIYTY